MLRPHLLLSWAGADPASLSPSWTWTQGAGDTFTNALEKPGPGQAPEPCSRPRVSPPDRAWRSQRRMGLGGRRHKAWGLRTSGTNTQAQSKAVTGQLGQHQRAPCKTQLRRMLGREPRGPRGRSPGHSGSGHSRLAHSGLSQPSLEHRSTQGCGHPGSRLLGGEQEGQEGRRTQSCPAASPRKGGEGALAFWPLCPARNSSCPSPLPGSAAPCLGATQSRMINTCPVWMVSHGHVFFGFNESY